MKFRCTKDVDSFYACLISVKLKVKIGDKKKREY